MAEFRETLYDTYGQHFGIEEVYFEHRTEHQHLLIFRNAHFGRIMALDGVVQTTERDEFIYHEMLAHTPILAHGTAKRILIIGGGDGAMLREVCRHKTVEYITQVEIDAAVVDMCRQYLPNHSQGAYDDPRLKLLIADGMQYVREADERFDVIISDSTDPIGPGEILFSQDFYAACRQRLNPGGVLVTQNGVAFNQLDEVKTTAQRLQLVFGDWHFYGAAVPTYIGGLMSFGWASDNPWLRQIPFAELQQRYQAAGLTTRYYNPAVHQAAFALPQYILEAIGKTTPIGKTTQ